MFATLPDGRIQLNEPLYHSVWIGDGIEFRVTVPQGYVSDGASIPWFLWPIIGPPIRDSHLIPAIVHDWLCDQAESYNDRVLGDAVFFKMLREFQVPLWKRTLMYIGVRFWGRWMWRADRAKTCCWLLLLPFLMAAHHPPEPQIVVASCRVSRVIDGDTVEIERTVRFRVRLRDCWAAETRSASTREKQLGLTSRDALYFAERQPCVLRVTPDGDEDVGDGLTFGRVVGEVFLHSGLSLGRHQVETGHAYATKAELTKHLRESHR